MKPTRPQIQRRPYGTGTIEPRWEGDRWRFRARYPDGRGGYRSLGTSDTELDAHDACNAAHAAARESGQSGSTPTLEARGERWLDAITDRNARSWRSTWRTVVAAAPFFQIPIDEITRPDVRDWARGLLRHVSPQTKRPISWQTAKHALGLVRRCLAEALEDGLISTNPAAGVRLPRREKRAEGWTYLSLDEIAQLLACEWMPLGTRTAYAVAVFVGLRQGEIAALTWDRVVLDGARPSLRVLESWDSGTKSGDPRAAWLIPSAVAALRTWWIESGRPKTGPVWTSKQRKGKAMRKGYDWGWADTTDLKAGICRLGWRRRVGILREVRFHDLRHTCASHLVMGSWGHAWELVEVRDQLGHSSVEVTERYGHLAPDALAATAARTFPQPPRRVSGDDQQLRDFILQAVRGSNLRPSAPEAQREPRNDSAFLLSGEVSGSSGAETLIAPAIATEVRALLELLAAGVELPRERLDALCVAVLTSRPVLAAKGLAGASADDAPYRLLDLAETLGIDASTAARRESAG